MVVDDEENSSKFDNLNNVHMHDSGAMDSGAKVGRPKGRLKVQV